MHLPPFIKNMGSSTTKANYKRPSPILRWAGGKSWLISKLPEFLPERFNNYHEPFLGGACVYFFLKTNRLIEGSSFLSDLNADLINCYRQLRNNQGNLLKILNSYKNTEDFYYSIRAKSNEGPLKSAANFLYLNRTSFNGLFRVNLNGDYNVPYGFKSYKSLFDLDALSEAKKLLKSAKLRACDFEESLTNISSHDLVFIDPPYTIAHNHNGFIKYNQKLFSWQDQERLLLYIKELNRRNAFFILTNAAHKSIKKLFENEADIYKLSRASLIGGSGAKRIAIHEYLFTNVRHK